MRKMIGDGIESTRGTNTTPLNFRDFRERRRGASKGAKGGERRASRFEYLTVRVETLLSRNPDIPLSVSLVFIYLFIYLFIYFCLFPPVISDIYAGFLK